MMIQTESIRRKIYFGTQTFVTNVFFMDTFEFYISYKSSPAISMCFHLFLHSSNPNLGSVDRSSFSE